MKKFIFAAAVSVAALAALPAAAMDAYGQLTFGLVPDGDIDATGTITSGSTTTPFAGELDLQPGWLLSGAVGVNVGHGLRTDAELLYTANDIHDLDSFEIHQWAVMANVSYDFFPDAVVTPYLGGGVGYGKTSFSIGNDDASDTGMAWQVKAGMALHPSEKVTVDFGYRYLRMADWDASITDGSDLLALNLETTQQVVSATLRFKFGPAE